MLPQDAPFIFTAIPIHDSQGRIVAAVEGVQDITERKEGEAAPRRSEARFRSLFEEVPAIAVQGYGPDGIVRYWNKASEHLYGYTASEAMGCDILALLVPPSLRAAMRNRITPSSPVPPRNCSSRARTVRR